MKLVEIHRQNLIKVFLCSRTIDYIETGQNNSESSAEYMRIYAYKCAI